MQPVIELQDVTFRYESASEPALNNIRLTIRQGEWVSLIGPGDSGKTTACRLLCGSLQSWPGARLEGKLFIYGEDRSHATTLDMAGQIGAVFQNPDDCLVHEYVEDELAFGPENLRVPPEQIELRIDQALDAIGMTEARTARTSLLSGGQKQRIAIASMLSMQPDILIFDEAAANLDAIAAAMLAETLTRLHRRGHTIVTASSRLDPDMAADRMILLEQGRIVAVGTPAEITADTAALKRLGCLPDERAYRTAASLHPSPHLTAVEQSAASIQPAEVAQQAAAAQPAMAIQPIKADQTAMPTQLAAAASESLPEHSKHSRNLPQEPLVQIRDLLFAYNGQSDQPILDGVNFDVYPGDILAILGPNGTGKTTLGKLLAGALTPIRGSIRLAGRDATDETMEDRASTVAYVFQQPEHQFVADTVLEECLFALETNVAGAVSDNEVDAWLGIFGLAELKNKSPFELSDVNKRLLNLASVMITRPDVVILDEPTAGLDYKQADRLMSHCANYAASGKGIILISHDMATVRKWATRSFRLG